MTLATLKADDLRAQAEQTHDRRQRSQFFDEIRRRGGARLSELSGQDGSLLTACNWRKLAEKDPVDAAVSLAVLMDRKRLRKGLEDEIAKTWMQNLADEALLVIVCIMARAEVAPVLKMVATENPDLFATAAERLTKTKSQGDRKAAAGMLAYVVPDSSIVPRMIKVGSRLLRAKLDAARAMAMEALANLGWKQVLRTARNVLEQGRTAMAGAALHVIGLFGTERDAPRLLQYVRRYLRHRPQLAETMDKIAKHLTIDLLREGLLQGSPDDQVAALSEISKRLPRPKLDRLLLNILPGLKNDMFADRVYKHLRQNEELAPQAIEAALKGKSSHLMKSVVDDIARGLSSSFTPRLKMLVAWGGGIVPEFDGQALSDGNGFPPIQKDASRRSLAASAALTRLADAMRPEQAADFVRLQFDSPAPAVRHAALTWFAKERQRLLPIEALLPLVRDPSDPVAGTALTMLLNYDDPRRLGEMASLIVQQKIGRHALAGARHLRGAAQSFQKLMSEQDIKDLVQQIEETIEWAKDAGRLLLGRDVEVKLLRWAMGRTRRARRGQTPTIEITDKPIAQRHPHGQEIMRALALHELGHHAFDFDHAGQTTIAGLIRKDGLFPIYNALLDERLERRLRRKNSEWGPLLDRLLSYAFMQEPTKVDAKDYAAALDRPVEDVIRDVENRQLPGKLITTTVGLPKVELRQIELVRIPGIVPPFAAFLVGLRCGLGKTMQSDGSVREALDAVPRNIKDLTHHEMLMLTRKIGRLLGGRKGAKQAQQRMQDMMRRHRWVKRMLGSLIRRLEERGLPPEGDGRGEAIESSEAETKVKPSPRLRQNPRDAFTSRGPSIRQRNESPTTDFRKLNLVWKPHHDPAAHQKVLGPVRSSVASLHEAMQRLALRDTDLLGVRRGRRLDQAAIRRLPRRPWSSDLMIGIERRYYLDAYIGLVIDKSGSMRGKRMELARAYGTMVSEAAGRLPGVEGHVATFDGKDYTVCGDLRRNSIAKAEAGGDNNDAGAIWQAVQLARRSSKRHRLIIMVNDDEPTGSSVAAIRHVVESAQRENIICAQVMVAPSKGRSSFPHAIDVAKLDFPRAVAEFTRLLMKLTATWR